MFLKQLFTMVVVEGDPQNIPGLMDKERFDVILLDMNFRPGDTSGEEGMKWLRRIYEEDPHVSVILITAYGGVNIAVEAIKEVIIHDVGSIQAQPFKTGGGPP